MAIEGKQRQCVAIARDALKQIEAKRYLAKHGTYGERYFRGLPKSKSGFQAAVKKFKYCEVCAVGALFTSLVRKYDDCTPESRYHDKLREYFTCDEVEEIEDYFEGWGDYKSYSCISYAGKDNPRLKKILNNIIRNRGHFIAPKD